MKLTRQAQLFSYTDKVIKAYLLLLIREFSKIQRKVSVTAFDEVNVISAVNTEWGEIDRLMKEALQRIAIYYYHLGCDHCKQEYEDELFILYFLAYLDDFDELTHYQYNNELDRKRARLIEALLSVNTLTKRKEQLQTALKLLTKQFKQTADNVTGMAILRAFEEAGVKNVEWVTQRDERVCPVCGALDRKVFPIKKCPMLPQHYNCRCFVIPYKFDSGLASIL